jgi:type III secretion system YscI/HrpB-like protein
MEPTSIGAAVAATAKSAPAAGAAVHPASAAAGADVERFRALMSPTPADAQATTAASRIDAAAAVESGAPSNLGDAILQKLHAISGELDDNWRTLTSIGGTGDASVSVPELMKFQTTAMQTSFQFDLVGKVVSKSEQDIEALVKMQ